MLRPFRRVSLCSGMLLCYCWLYVALLAPWSTTSVVVSVSALKPGRRTERVAVAARREHVLLKNALFGYRGGGEPSFAAGASAATKTMLMASTTNNSLSVSSSAETSIATSTSSNNGAQSTGTGQGTKNGKSNVSSAVVVVGSKEDEGGSTESPLPKSEDPRVMFLIRILFLSYYASLGALMPYLPVYYHSLGHGGQIIGMLGAVKPLTTFLVAPFWGLVADQTQAPFKILKVTFLVSLVGQLLVVGNKDFRYIMFMVFITALFNAPVKSLIDTMVMDHINDRSQYGRLRLWGQLGFGLGSSGVGIILSRSKGVISSTATSVPERWLELIAKLPSYLQQFIHLTDKFWQAITGYRLLFLAHAALSVPTWLAITAFQQLDKESKEAAPKLLKKKQKETIKGAARINEGLKLLIHNGDALLFFFLIFVVGISSGVVENFAYVRMREVGGTGREMGLSRLVSSIAGAPMFWFSGPLTEKLGADRVLVLSLCSYVCRFLIYAFMKHPLQGLPAEALRGITFAAFWSTGTVYAHRISPPGLHATMVKYILYLLRSSSFFALHLGTAYTYLD